MAVRALWEMVVGVEVGVGRGRCSHGHSLQGKCLDGKRQFRARATSASQRSAVTMLINPLIVIPYRYDHITTFVTRLQGLFNRPYEL